MLNRFIHRLLARRHFWRDGEFGEIAEVYATAMLRAMAVGMTAVFVGIYLLDTGYSLGFVTGHFALYFAVKAAWAWPSARIIARFGPKHAVLISNFCYIPALLALALLPQLGLVSLAIVAVVQTLSVSLYEIAQDVSLSKLKHADHAGKEIGFALIMTRVGTALSPLIGGAVATLAGPQATILAGAVVFMFAAAPSLMTPEVIRTHQAITLTSVPWREYKRALWSRFAVGVDGGASGSLWSLFITVVVLRSVTRNAYVTVGALSSLAFVSVIVAARLYGAMIDRQHGRGLLAVGVLANAALHAGRAGITSITPVAAINVANELATTAYNLPYAKGLYDLADSLPGRRIAFLAGMDIAINLGAACILGLSCIFVLLAGPAAGLKLSYLAVAVMTLPILLNGFRIRR